MIAFKPLSIRLILACLILACLFIAGIAIAAPVAWHYDADGTIQLDQKPCDADRELVNDLRHEVERTRAELRYYKAEYRARRIKR